MSEVWDSADFEQKVSEVKTKLSLLSSDKERNSLKEFYAMGMITPLLDEIGADPAVIVGGHAVPDGYCYIIGVEDLILDRLKAALYWSDSRSEEWAAYLLSSQFERADMDYLTQTAGREDPQLLMKLNEMIEWVRKNKPLK